MERTGKRWAVGLAATFWVGAATVMITEATRGVAALLLFLCGAAVLLVGWWPQIRLRFQIKDQRPSQRVGIEIKDYIDELDQLYHRSQPDPSEDGLQQAFRARERANDLLVPWKRRVLEYLASTIGHRAALDFWCLGDTRNDGAPGKHVRDSYERHREHLERIVAEVELGEIRVKWPPQRSGEPLPPVEDFVVKPPPCR